ncbi:MAG: HEPN domain-containing protein [Phycisphaerae bacterium]
MSDPASDERDPRVWLGRAESCLALAREGHGMSAVFLEDLCFQAQQAVEKVLKGLLILKSEHFPKTHDLRDLLTRVEQTGFVLPSTFRAAADLTVYAIMTRYPGGPAVTEADYQAALKIATDVVAWVRRELETAGK